LISAPTPSVKETTTSCSLSMTMSNLSKDWFYSFCTLSPSPVRYVHLSCPSSIRCFRPALRDRTHILHFIRFRYREVWW
jgi:hypothetical protein